MPDWITDFRTILAIIAAIGGIGYWIGQVNSDRKSFKEFMREVREDIKTILDRLPPPQTSSGKSPAQLTEFGEKVAELIQAHAWASEASSSVIDDQSLRDLEPFQIESFCEKYVEDESVKGGKVQEMIEIAMYEFGIDRGRALPVLRIPLRESLPARRELLSVPPIE